MSTCWSSFQAQTSVLPFVESLETLQERYRLTDRPAQWDVSLQASYISLSVRLHISSACMFDNKSLKTSAYDDCDVKMNAGICCVWDEHCRSIVQGSLVAKQWVSRSCNNNNNNNNNSNNNNNNDDNNNNNNRIQRRKSRLFFYNLLTAP